MSLRPGPSRNSPAPPAARDSLPFQLPAAAPERSIVLVGLMGAGKSSVGRRLATRLGLAFTDSDQEIERAAGLTIDEIFARHGEAAFRDGERRVLARLLRGPSQVIATGGGSFMNAETRALIREHGRSVWLKAELDELVERVSRRSNRPLLKGGDPRAILQRLIAERYPIYAEADVTVTSSGVSLEITVERVLEALRQAALATAPAWPACEQP